MYSISEIDLEIRSLLSDIALATIASNQSDMASIKLQRLELLYLEKKLTRQGHLKWSEKLH